MTDTTPSKQFARLSERGDEEIRQGLASIGREDISPEQFRKWEQSLPTGQKLNADLGGNLFVAEGRNIIGTFDEGTGQIVPW